MGDVLIEGSPTAAYPWLDITAVELESDGERLTVRMSLAADPLYRPHYWAVQLGRNDPLDGYDLAYDTSEGARVRKSSGADRSPAEGGPENGMIQLTASAEGLVDVTGELLLWFASTEATTPEFLLAQDGCGSRESPLTLG